MFDPAFKISLGVGVGLASVAIVLSLLPMTLLTKEIVVSGFALLAVIAFGMAAWSIPGKWQWPIVFRSPITSSQPFESTPVSIAAPHKIASPNFVFLSYRLEPISDPLDWRESVEALLVSFHNAPAADSYLEGAESVRAAISFTKIADSEMLTESIRRYLKRAERAEESQPEENEFQCLGSEKVIAASWLTTVRTNDISFGRDSVRDLIVGFRRGWTFYALEDSTLDRPYRPIRCPELTAGQWELSVHLSIEGKLDRTFFFGLFVYDDEPPGVIHRLESPLPFPFSVR